jgi:hypothetical protein
MSGSPKYSSVSYSSARQQAQERERRERERAHRQAVQESRRHAELLAKEQAISSAGMLAELDAEMAYLHRGAAFAPEMAADIQVVSEQLEAARALYRQRRFAEAETACSQLQPRAAAIRETVESEAEQLALRLATLEALSTGLRTRGYEVGEALAQSDGTIALRAHLAGRAGLDLALVSGADGDEVVWQRHDAGAPESESAGCESVTDLHRELRLELAGSGIDLGSLRWTGQSSDLADQSMPSHGHEGNR